MHKLLCNFSSYVPISKGILLLGWAFLFSSCHTSRPFFKSIDRHIQTDSTFQKAFSGFIFIDPITDEILYEQNAHKYFTPASNTKILTLFSALSTLPTEPDAAIYSIQGDSVIVWGTGNPLFEKSRKTDNNAWSVFQDSTYNLFYSDTNWQDKKWGPGWAWDDGQYVFQKEKSALPLFDNQILFFKNKESTTIETLPNTTVTDSHYRSLLALDEDRDSIKMPLKEVQQSTSELLSLVLDRPVKNIDLPIFNVDYIQPVKGDSIYPLLREMMVESDNFLAEQFLLMIAHEKHGKLNTKAAIQYTKDSLLNFLPDEVIWIDGSGLSRYNKLTPHSIAVLLTEMYQRFDEKFLLSFFPHGGVSGTIENWYAGSEEPYVFAKTGTLTGVHCLSGYLKTKKGKILAFSMMHNNYKGSSKEYKVAMERLLQKLR